MNERTKESAAVDYDDQRTAARERIRRLSNILDSAIRLPGGYRIGLDGILGLLPGIGDTLGAAASGYIILEAARLGASVPTLLRMVGNVLLESVVGVIPVVGDLFDFAWKANNRNVELLEEQLRKLPARGTPSQRVSWTALVIVVLLVAGVAGLAFAAFSLLAGLIGMFAD